MNPISTVDHKEFAQKYYGLKRNYDSITRICKDTCSKNEELEKEITKLRGERNKFDEVFEKNKLIIKQNNELIENNTKLNDSLKLLEKKINLNEMHMNEMKESLKIKSKIQIDLENQIEVLSKSLSETQYKEKIHSKKNEKLNKIINDLNVEIENVKNQHQDLNEKIINIKLENGKLKTSMIRKDNILLLKENKIKSLNTLFKENNIEYNKLYKEYKQIEIKYSLTESKSKNLQLDVDILTNRLKHFDEI